MKAALRDILTAREFEVCEMVAEGRTTPEIGASLGISTRTVENHIYSAARLIPGESTPMRRIMLAFLQPGPDSLPE